MNVEISVVIPVYNEEQSLAALFARLYPALDALGVPYEVIFINDGSTDRSAAVLQHMLHRALGEKELRAHVDELLDGDRRLATDCGHTHANLTSSSKCRTYL